MRRFALWKRRLKLEVVSLSFNTDEATSLRFWRYGKVITTPQGNTLLLTEPGTYFMVRGEPDWIDFMKISWDTRDFPEIITQGYSYLNPPSEQEMKHLSHELQIPAAVQLFFNEQVAAMQPAD